MEKRLLLAHIGLILAAANYMMAMSKENKLPNFPQAYVVAKFGGNFGTLQEAIDRVPLNNSQRVTIYVKRGTYREKVRIPRSKPFISLKGDGADETCIEWGDTASDLLGPNGWPLGTYGSASVAVESHNFIASGISFKNTAHESHIHGSVPKQAVALSVKGDKAMFIKCNFYGAQDTLYDKEGRHYYYNCYIQGSIDFIFGNARSLFMGCKIHSIASNFGYITAQKRMKFGQNTGFSFVHCIVNGSGSIYLGRPWGPYSTVVYSYTYFDSLIHPEGWKTWKNTTNQVFYGEYNCYGPGSSMEGRVRWSKRLTSRQAHHFLTIDFIDGKEWLPTYIL